MFGAPKLKGEGQQLAFLLLLILCGCHWGTDYTNLQWTIGLVLASVFLIKHLPPIWWLPAFYFIAQGLLHVLSFIYQSKSVVYITSASMATSCFVGSIAVGLLFKKISNKTMAIFGVANAVFMLVEKLLGTEIYVLRQSGFIDYAGVNGCLLAISIPFLLDEIYDSLDTFYLVGLGLVLVGIFLSRSTIPYVVTAIVSTTYLSLKRKSILTATLPILLAISAILYQGIHKVSAGMRFEAIKVFMGYWWKNNHIWFGEGAGSFKVLAREIQLRTGFMNVINAETHEVGINYWPVLHSDWLQVMFEYGIVGFYVALGIFIIATILLYRKKDYATFSMVIGIGATAILNYPVRYFVFAALSVIALIRAVEETQPCPL